MDGYPVPSFPKGYVLERQWREMAQYDCDDDLMRPDYGFDKLLPISAPREQEHQRECPHEMRSQEEKASPEEARADTLLSIQP